MTLFYLLSGYTLVLSYGGRNTWSWSDKGWFCWNRFVRIAPSFYLSNIAAFLISFDYKTILLNKTLLITTLTISNSWFKPLSESFQPYNFPSWTVSTLSLMYLFFPLVLPLLKKLSDTSLARSLVILNSVQLLPVIYTIILQIEPKE